MGRARGRPAGGMKHGTQRGGRPGHESRAADFFAVNARGPSGHTRASSGGHGGGIAVMATAPCPAARASTRHTRPPSGRGCASSGTRALLDPPDSCPSAMGAAASTLGVPQHRALADISARTLPVHAQQRTRCACKCQPNRQTCQRRACPGSVKRG